MFRVLRHLKQFKKYAIITPIFVILECAIDLLIPFEMAEIINQAKVGDLKQIFILGAIMFAMSGVALVLGICSGSMAARASTGLAYNLRNDLFSKVQEYSFENIDNFSISSLITRITTDISFIQHSFQFALRTIIRAPIMITIATILVCVINWKFALLFIGVLVIMFGVIPFAFIVLNKNLRKLFKELDRLNEVTGENLSGIRVIKAYVRDAHEIKKFDRVANRVYKFSVKVDGIIALFIPLMFILNFSLMITIQVIGGQDIIKGSMSVGSLASLLAYATQVFMSLMMFSVGLMLILFAKNSVTRVVEAIEEKSTIVNPKNPIYNVKDGSIEFQHVDFSYTQKSDEKILKNFSMKINDGETIGILGGTGSAKSTIVNLIPRLYDISKGSVMVGGVDVRDYDLKTLRDSVSIVLQKNVLFSGSIRDNMKWGKPDATDEEIYQALDISQATEFVNDKKGGLDYELGKGGVNVSGGQKQRLCIARALLKDPKVIIFDDSTSAVDAKTDFAIRNGLKKYKPNLTKIIITQRIHSIIDADRIFVLDDGVIVGEGTHSELLKNNDIYKEVYDTQLSLDGGASHEA